MIANGNFLAESGESVIPTFFKFLEFLGIYKSRKPLEVGELVPEVSALDQDGQRVRLPSLGEHQFLFVFFYIKADTPGCTAQACSLRDAFDELMKRGVCVVGVSSDSISEQKKFKEKYALPFTLIADLDLKVIEAFGVSTLLSRPSRQAFLIQHGKVIWRDLKASTKKQAEDVLTWIRSFH